MKRRKVLTAFLLTATFAFLALPGLAEEEPTRMIIKKRVETADGAKSAEAEAHVMFIGEDGNKIVLEGGHPGHALVMHHGCDGKGAFLGVQLVEITSDLRDYFGVPDDVGVLVGKVLPDTPAETAGLRAGDVLTRVDGVEVGSSGELSKQIRGKEPGDVVQLEVTRDHRVETFSATLIEAKGHAMHAEKMIWIEADGGELDCPTGECEIEVICKAGECECTLNGEEIDCEEVPGFEHP